MGTTSSVYTPVGFSGVSQYSSDFQSVMTRQQAIDAVPVTALTNQNTDMASEDTSLTALNTAAAALTTDLTNIGQLSTGLALSATTTDATAVTASITGTTSPASYTVTNVTSVASSASETSSVGYASAATSNVVSSSGSLQMQLIAGSQNITFTLTAATNNLTGVAAAINNLDAGVTATVITTGSGSTDNYLSLSSNSPGATTLQLNAVGGTATGSATAAGTTTLATATTLQVQGTGLTAPVDFAFTAGETVTTALAALQDTTSGAGAQLAAAGITVTGAAGGKLAFTSATGTVNVATSGDTTNSLGFGISTNTLFSTGQSLTAAAAPAAGASNGQSFGISLAGGAAIDIGTGVITGATAAETGAAAAAGLNAAIASDTSLTAAGLTVTADATTGALTFSTTATTGPAFTVDVTSDDGVTGGAGTSTNLGFGLGSATAAQPVSGTNILTSANQGSDSKFDLNGIPVDSPNTAVSGVIPGVTLNILGLTIANETVGVTVATDNSAISAALTNLVTDYNTLALQVNAQIGPSAGLLSGSPIVSQLREAMSSLVHYQGSGTGSITNIANLGIEANADGTLTLNTTTFAGLSDSDVASALTFFGSSATTGLGSLQSTFDAVSDPLSGSIAGQLSADSKSTTALTAQIATMNAQIAVSEQTLLAELEAADAQVADLTTQQNLLTSSISSLQFTSYGYQSQQTAAG